MEWQGESCLLWVNQKKNCFCPFLFSSPWINSRIFKLTSSAFKIAISWFVAKYDVWILKLYTLSQEIFKKSPCWLENAAFNENRKGISRNEKSLAFNWACRITFSSCFLGKTISQAILSSFTVSNDNSALNIKFFFFIVFSATIHSIQNILSNIYKSTYKAVI